ncbi:thiolase-like protein, partial [Trichocladium antarcticum]
AKGYGLVVVKKLTDAIRKGDYIYSVVRSTGINQYSTAKSITYLDDVLDSSRVAPETIRVVEAYSTGTLAGDFAEVSSVQAVFRNRPPENPLYIMSVKGNIGHTKAASSIAGLAKLLA